VCAWWLAAELRLVRPKLVVALGATAAYSLLGSHVKVTRDRGSVLRPPHLPTGFHHHTPVLALANIRSTDGRASRSTICR
jgi:DNA polymerase